MLAGFTVTATFVFDAVFEFAVDELHADAAIDPHNKASNNLDDIYVFLYVLK